MEYGKTAMMSPFPHSAKLHAGYSLVLRFHAGIDNFWLFLGEAGISKLTGWSINKRVLTIKPLYNQQKLKGYVMEQEQQETSNETQGNGVLDRTIGLLKKFNLYLLTLATVVGSWYALHDVAKVENEYIYLLVSVPFLLLILFEILPAWYKNARLISWLN